MTLRSLPLTAGLLAALALRGLAADAPPLPFPQQNGPPPQPDYQDCITHSCQLVPEVKQIKTTVYEVQEVPFCVKKLPPLWSLFCHRGCDACEVCPDCQPPRYRKVMTKKEVVCKEICTTKCVVQEHVERVPCPACPPCPPCE
jgi:hypothetical protein